MQSTSEEDYAIHINPNKTCRVCLKQPPDVVTVKNLFCKEIVDGQLVLLPKLIQDLMQIKVRYTDGFYWDASSKS